MNNPTTITVKSNHAVEAYHYRLTMGDAEALIKETTVTGPFAPGAEVTKNLYDDGLVPQVPPFGPPLKFSVWATTTHGDSPVAQSAVLSFSLEAPTVTLA